MSPDYRLCRTCGRECPKGSLRCPRCDAPIAVPDEADASLVASETTTEPPGPAVPPHIVSADDRATVLPPDEGAIGGVPGEPQGGRPFGRRYRILRTVGQGGMGEVYEAWDQELGVPVALKVIRPDVMEGPAGRGLERRFKKELLLAREVTHRNVVRIHDLGDVDGVKYISMDYVSGSSLSDLLKTRGTLEVPRLLRYARQIAGGLAAAHDVGVVHRDLKPANIMISDDDEALIMDFGIARVATMPDVAEPGTVRGTRSLSLTAYEFDTTSPGAVLGTAAYMAPEQAQGLPVDQRADVYAFGLILYDCLTTGRRGTTAEERRAEMKQRLDTGPEPLDRREPDLPAPLCALVMRCLAPSPAQRYQSVAELGAALDELDDEGRLRPKLLRLGRWQLAAAVALVVSLTSALWWFTRPPPVLVQPDPISVLVADFEYGTADPGFGDAVEGALAVALEGASFIFAYPREDARSLAQTMRWGDVLDETTARLVAAREGIDVIIAGRIVRDGDRYTIHTTSLDALVSDAAPLAEVETVAASAETLPVAVGELSAKLRGALGDTTPESARLAEVETFTSSSLEAIRAYTQAQALAQSSDNEAAIALYEEAIAHDPEFGRAHAGLATSALFAGRDAEALFDNALAQVGRMTDRERLRTLGVYHLGVTGDYQAALDTYTSLVDQYPADAVGYNNLAYSYFFLRDFPKAMAAAAEGLALYPNQPVQRNNFVLYTMYAGDFERARDEAERSFDLSPAAAGFFKSYLPIAIDAVVRGDDDAVREAYRRMGGVDARGAAHASIGLADYAMSQGRWGDALGLLTTALADETQAGVVGPSLAMQVALAETQTARGDTAAAPATLNAVLRRSRDHAVLVPAARLLVRLGDPDAAAAIAEELSGRLPAQERAYGLVLEAVLARAEGRTTEAVDLLRRAIDLTDLWLARYELGITFLEIGPAGAAQALGELRACLDRRGEATAVFLDDIPSYRYMAELPYWLGRAQAGTFDAASARASFQAYITLREGADVPDPLVEDARARLAAL